MNKILILALLCLSPFCYATEANRFNLTASDAHNFVWFRVAKVGTRTIYQILRDNKVPYTAKGSHILFNPSAYRKHFKFAFVRNPWSRVVSCYFNKVVTKVHPPFKECFGKDFDYFVDFIAKKNLKRGDIHIRLQTELFPVDEVDFIGRLERFSEDLAVVLNILGLKCESIPHKNSSRHEHYSKYYTERTKKIIGQKYKADIEAFGYKFEMPKKK